MCKRAVVWYSGIGVVTVELSDVDSDRCLPSSKVAHKMRHKHENELLAWCV